MKMNIAILATTIAAASLLAACSQPADNTAEDARTSAAEMEMPMAEHAQMPGAAAAEMKIAASGTIESIDADAGKITIKHGPVEALDWPGMTMAFKATPEQIASVEVGQSVDFEFESSGMDATITRITPE